MKLQPRSEHPHGLKEQLKNKLIEHKQYIDKNGEDLPEIRNWKWSPGGAWKEKALSVEEK